MQELIHNTRLVVFTHQAQGFLQLNSAGEGHSLKPTIKVDRNQEL